jgi:hypothetical protein
MTNIIPFERKKIKYTEIVTVNINLEASEDIRQMEAAYNILRKLMITTESADLRERLMPVLHSMEVEL